MDKVVMAYVGRCSVCGTIYFKAVDRQRIDRSALAEDIREIIASGDYIERMTLDEANAAPWAACSCKTDQKTEG